MPSPLLNGFSLQPLDSGTDPYLAGQIAAEHVKGQVYRLACPNSHQLMLTCVLQRPISKCYGHYAPLYW